MPKIGLIVEGTTEERVLRPLICRHLESRSAELPVEELMGRVIPDGGNKVRTKGWVKEQVRRLKQGGHDRIMVIADRERHPSSTAVRERLLSCGADAVIVASPKFERWLLADENAVLAVLGRNRPSNWKSDDPLTVLRGMKPGYQKVSDGTLLGEASEAASWAAEDVEFCALLRMLEGWVGLALTSCTEVVLKTTTSPHKKHFRVFAKKQKRRPRK